MSLSYDDWQMMLKRQSANGSTATARPGGTSQGKRKAAKPFAVGAFIKEHATRPKPEDPGPLCRYCNITKMVKGGHVCTGCTIRRAVGFPFRCLAIDPSVGNLGYTVLDAVDKGEGFRIEDGGRWHPSTAVGAPDRFIQMGSVTTAMIEHFRPSDVVIEMPHAHQAVGSDGKKRSFRPLMIYSVGVGFIAGVASMSGCRLWRPDAVQWKGAGTQKGSTAQQVELVLGVKHRSPDEVDAAGLALWWYTQIHPSLTGGMPLVFEPPF